MKQNVSYECNYGSVNSWMTASNTGHSESSRARRFLEAARRLSRAYVAGTADARIACGHMTLFILRLDLRGAREALFTTVNCLLAVIQEFTEP